MRLLNQVLAVSLAALALGACGAPPPPPRRAPPPPPVAKTTDDDKANQQQTIYVYSPVGKRDPFENVFAIKEVTPVKVPGAKPGPTQKYSLDKYKLSMTVTGTATPMATLEDPDGRGWTVRIGSFVGQNWGKVSSIQRDQIVVTETITDHATGKVYPQLIPIRVNTSDSERAAEAQLHEGETLGAAQTNPGN